MGALQLRILEPLDGARIAAAGDVRLRGEVVGGYTGTLYFRWYSTLNPAATKTAQELNAPVYDTTRLNWTTPLGVGTHVITFAATDQQGSDTASVQAVTRGGFSGGAPVPGNNAPCVMHRLIAVLRQPTAGASVSKASATIEMQAPARWAKKDNGAWVLDAEYHAVNRVRFSFTFAPSGTPQGRQSTTIKPEVADLQFFMDGTTPYLRWTHAVPTLGTQDVGAYVLTLTVDTPDGPEKHETSVNVTLTL
jgi:hypothetical protein